MALITHTVETGHGFRVYTWANVLTGSTVTAAELGGQADRSVQFSGTWGSCTMLLKGSQDDTTYFTLTDPQGNAISKTVDAIEQIEELTRYVQPSFSGGDGTQSLTISIFVVRKP